MYCKVSPFMFPNKIKAPMVLIHGGAANNAGTLPVEPDRRYRVTKGNGGSLR